MESTNLSQLPATAVMEASPDGLVLCDATGVILFVNAAMAAMSGYDKAELIGQRIEVHTIFIKTCRQPHWMRKR